MYNHEVTLISHTIVKDEIGNEVKTSVERKILCKIGSVGSTEFYNAQVSDLKPELKIIVHTFEYEGEKELIFEGKNYKVLRTFIGDTVDKTDNALKGEEIELTCEKVIGRG